MLMASGFWPEFDDTSWVNGYIPANDTGRSPEFVSHETACIVPIIVQHTRRDFLRAEMALLSTIAYAG